MNLDSENSERHHGVDASVDKVQPGSLRALRDAFGAFATGITIVTAAGPQGEPVGLTVNSFSSVSLEPPLVAWSLHKSSALRGCFEPGRRCAIHVLRSDQEVLARRFALARVSRFSSIAWHNGRDGVPVIDNVLARFDCLTEIAHDAGDHRLLMARVEHYVNVPGEPLVFAHGRFRAL